METKAFKLNKMVKKFPGFQLGPLNLDLSPGVVMGYIGANGAGKTTTMHCMTGLIKQDSGDIEIFDKTANPYHTDWKHDIGYVGDRHVFFEKWSGEKNLNFISRFYPHWSDEKAIELVKRFRFPLEKRAKDLSSGNRVKLSLISALAHSPRLLILDEPTSGLDPIIRSELLDELFDILQDGERAIFYSTHILTDITRLVDKLCFLDEGQILARTSKEELLEKWRRISFKLSSPPEKFNAAIDPRREGIHHQLISYDRSHTITQLRQLGAKDLRETRLGIDEISVYILKGGKNVAPD